MAFNYKQQYAVVVMCKDEPEQEAVYNRLKEEGFKLLILLEHELLHIGVNTDGNEPSFYIVPHDIEDFRSIIEKYGTDWSDKRG